MTRGSPCGDVRLPLEHGRLFAPRRSHRAGRPRGARDDHHAKALLAFCGQDPGRRGGEFFEGENSSSSFGWVLFNLIVFFVLVLGD